ncbi:hypothetical protein NDU88_001309 [Pleurodeles waltl]|uniref:Uncharacterized protein n=1 Tax=Pleurodeles waltl TaxID=8319 RepID=A0AAV7TIE1_PLEWA|nr:hypothetical protein NDU88_001309 [Pleurodeles waltl]
MSVQGVVWPGSGLATLAFPCPPVGTGLRTPHRAAPCGQPVLLFPLQGPVLEAPRLGEAQSGRAATARRGPAAARTAESLGLGSQGFATRAIVVTEKYAFLA